jgi:hypothetical protein
MSERVVDAEEPFPRGGWEVGGTQDVQYIGLKALYDFSGKADFGVVSIGPTSTQLTADEAIILAEAATSLALHLNPNAFQSLDHVPVAEMAPENLTDRLKSLVSLIGGRVDNIETSEEVLARLEYGLKGYFSEGNPKGDGIPTLELLRSEMINLRNSHWTAEHREKERADKLNTTMNRVSALEDEIGQHSIRLQAVQDRERERAVNTATRLDTLHSRMKNLEETVDENSERQIATEKTLSEADYRSRCNSSRATNTELDIKYIKKALGATREAIEEMERPF